MNAFAVSDIHGAYASFQKILTYWNPSDKLIILGDMIDRGPCSYEVVKTVMNLVEKHDVIYLRGNHEQMLLDYLENPEGAGSLYYLNGGIKTIASFIKSIQPTDNDQEIAKKVGEVCSEEVAFLKTGAFYYQFGKILFTHAGFCSWYSDWRKTANTEFIWTRGHFRYPNQTSFVNVFGHTPTQLINKDRSNRVWISEDYKYIGIDGACSYGGQLNAVLISDTGKLLETYQVKS